MLARLVGQIGSENSFCFLVSPAPSAVGKSNAVVAQSVFDYIKTPRFGLLPAEAKRVQWL
jgi:hypothetical protein